MATEWDAAVKAESEARDIAERFYTEQQPAFDPPDAGAAATAEVLEFEEAYGELTSAHYDTLHALLRTPAPSFGAVLTKLQMGCADAFFIGSKDCFEALTAIADDIKRLSGEV